MSKNKPGRIRRLWRKCRNIDWKNPVNRWKLFFVGLIGCIVIFGGMTGVIAFTNSPTFCKSCHEMAPEYTTYSVTSHNQITCVQCHIKPGLLNMMTHKMKSLKEVYYHVTGVPEQIVQTEEEAISNVNCLQCHSKNRLVTASGDLKVNHKGHIEEGIPCITCHAGVVHAKVAARDINTEKERDLWTISNAKKLVQEKYTDPNMGTCIDCHNKVNKGEKPWTDISYSVPANPEVHQKKTSQDTQNIILQAIGKQQVNVKLSMKCETCHKKIKVPPSHQWAYWKQAHGNTAIQELDQCLECHQDSEWIKEIPKQDIMSQLNQEKVKYVPNLTVVKDESRANKFCSTCHANRPPSHENTAIHSVDSWLTGHAREGSSPEGKARCFVCHDREKPKAGEVKPPTDVYCEYCHRTGFMDEQNN
ncbi:MAG: NapC/NirT family cytochrome c [Bacillota bacterium]|nr:NapC/NirT family cytochrome c [Bacillota bacterium]